MAHQRAEQGPALIATLVVTLALAVLPANAQSRRVLVADGAAQTLAAARSETLDILFRDGTSVLVGPGGTIRTRVGERIEIDSTSAVMRIARGQPGLAKPVVITTPHATLRLTSGSGVVAVADASTRAFLLIDGAMRVERAGQGRELYRAGFEVAATAAGPGRPRRMAEGEMVEALERISPGLGRVLGAADPVPVIVSQNATATTSPLVASRVVSDATSAEDTAASGAACDPRKEALAGLGGCDLPVDDVTLGAIRQPGGGDGGGAGGSGGTGGSGSGGGTGGGGGSVPVADFETGFGGLGLAGLYDVSSEPIGVVAQTGTSISDDNDGNAPLVFQSFGEPIEASLGDALGLLDLANDSAKFFAGTAPGFDPATSARDAAIQDLADVLPPLFLGPLVSYINSNGFGYFQRRRAVGPTTNAVIAGDTWQAFAVPRGSAELVGAVTDGFSDRPFQYLLGFPASTGAPSLGLTFFAPLESVGGLVLRKPTDETGANIFRLSEIRNATFFEEQFFEFDFNGDGVIDDGEGDFEFAPFIDYEDAEQHVGYALDFAGPFNGRGADNFLLVEVIEAEDAFESDPDTGFRQFAAGFTFDNESDFNTVNESIEIGLANDARPIAGGSRLVFAAGDLDGFVTGSPDTSFALAFDPGVATVDRFALTSSLSAFFAAEGTFSRTLSAITAPRDGRAVVNARAFLPADAWLDLLPPAEADMRDITDSGLLVVNPAAPMVDISGLDTVTPDSVVPGGADSRLLHADFGLRQLDGRQVSSISATIGEVDFRLYAEEQLRGVTREALIESAEAPGDPETGAPPPPAEYLNLSVDAVLSARTIGSSNDGTGRASTLAFSDWTSTSAGGGNPHIDTDFSGGADPGRLGFFVLQNAGSTIDDVVSDERVSFESGRFAPVGSDPERPDQEFGALRLGIATTDNTRELTTTDRRDGRFADPGGRGLIGYAQGFVESENGTAPQVGLAPLARIADGPNLAIAVPDADANTISGALAVPGRAAPIAFGGTGEIYGRPVDLGTFVDDLTWGMLSNEDGTQMAMISAEPVARELRGQFETSGGGEVPIPARDPVGKLGGGIDEAYEYAQWGFFFGDVVDTEGARRHVHLGTFAAGEAIDRSVLATASGTATYAGHAIGNVYDRGAVYTSVGTFSDTFDFDTRTGTPQMDFDRRSYSGSSSLNLADGVYSGSVAGGDRTGALNGRFVGGMRDGQPNALVGGFEIQNNSASPDSAYRAVGTFAGEK